ncbi:transposase [Pseudosulfitobacter koreensis]|uniref:Transposase n=1 Tax=Pseudosulfitobacter koreensis TaxID=2968472 RepID=A0ABT1YWJ2_9RHOB|nr:transposase [Pseudosulfitobacter koreense]MCR8825250.1 transposase [Pseudosulfitobacter koreense]
MEETSVCGENLAPLLILFIRTKRMCYRPLMTSDLFPNKTLERIHWISLFLGLPDAGLDATFPSEAACEAWLYQVRWPDGPVCPDCFETNMHFLDLRKVQTCRKCKKQFSLTSGTDLHGIHRGLRFYFELADEIIQYRQRGAMLTLRELQDNLGIAAWSSAAEAATAAGAADAAGVATSAAAEATVAAAVAATTEVAVDVAVTATATTAAAASADRAAFSLFGLFRLLL